MAHREQGACREVVEAEVQVEIKLITCQRHPVGTARDKLSYPRVHHRHLPLWISRPIRCAPATAVEPVVPVKPGDLIQHRLGRQVSLVNSRAADDQHEPTAVLRGIADLAEPGRQALT